MRLTWMPPPLLMTSSSCAESGRDGWYVKHHDMQFSSSIGTKAWPLSALSPYGGIMVWNGITHWVMRQ